MAEGVALAIPGLFLNCVEIFGLIQLGRDFDEDFGSWHLQLHANELRFQRWGTAAGITDERSETFVRQLQKNYPPKDIKLAYVACDRIKTKLHRANEDSKKLAFESDDPAELDIIDELKQLEISEPDVKRADGALRRLKSRYQTGFKQVVVRTKWALYKKEQLEDLLRAIAEHVTSLEQLFPQQAQVLVAEEAQALDQEAIKVLKGVVTSSSDPLLNDALRTEAGSQGLSWDDIDVSDYTTTHFGNIYLEAQPNGVSGSWNKIKARGNAVSHAGHVIGYQNPPRMQSAYGRDVVPSAMDDDDFPFGNGQARAQDGQGHRMGYGKGRENDQGQNGQGQNGQGQNSQGQSGQGQIAGTGQVRCGF